MKIQIISVTTPKVVKDPSFPLIHSHVFFPVHNDFHRLSLSLHPSHFCSPNIAGDDAELWPFSLIYPLPMNCLSKGIFFFYTPIPRSKNFSSFRHIIQQTNIFHSPLSFQNKLFCFCATSLIFLPSPPRLVAYPYPFSSLFFFEI